MKRRTAAGFKLLNLQRENPQKNLVMVYIKDISKQIFESYNEQYFEGPTGHKYFVTENIFQNAFENFVISYEFAILAHPD